MDSGSVLMRLAVLSRFWQAGARRADKMERHASLPQGLGENLPNEAAHGGPAESAPGPAAAGEPEPCPPSRLTSHAYVLANL